MSMTRDTMIGPFPLPPVTDELRAEAHGKPGEWIPFADPAVRPGTTDVPKFAFQGGYKVDEQGNIADYYINPAYEPSPRLTGFRFANGLELVLWRCLHGYNPLGLLADSLYHAELTAYATSADDTGLHVVTDSSTGESVLPVCTSAQWSSWQHTHQIEGPAILALAPQADGVLLDINPGTQLSLRLPLQALAALITDQTPQLLDRA